MERLHTADAAGSSYGSGNDSNNDSDEKPATTRSRRPARHLFGKISGVVAAGVVVGLLLFNNPGQWTLGGSDRNNDASSIQSPASAEDGVAETSADQRSLAVSPKANVEKKDMKIIDQAGGSALGFGGETENKEIEKDAPEVTSSADRSKSTGYNSSNETTEEVRESPIARESGGLFAGAGDAASGASEVPLMGFNEASKAEKFDDPPMSLNTIPASLSESPDGKWRAISVEDTGTFQIYKTEDNTEWFTSEPRVGKIGFLNWNETSTVLYYTFTDTEGSQTQWQFDTETSTESKR